MGRRGVLASVVVTAAVAFTGCSSSYLAEVPFALQACPYTTDNPHQTSTAAVLQALKENRWEMVGGSLADGYLNAKACRHTTCTVVDVFVDTRGNVEIYRGAEHQRLARDTAQLLESWMVKLAKRWESCRCDPGASYVDEAGRLTLPRGFVPSKPVATGR